MSIETSSDPQQFARFEHDGWNSVSDAYQRHFGRLTIQSVDAVLDAANLVTRARVLDVCCGPGMLAAAAAARGANVSAIDFSAQAIAIARESINGVDFQEADAAALPFDDASFDAVVCGFGLIHLPDPAQALREMNRVLKPGGGIAVSTWQPPSADNGFGLLYAAIKAHANMDLSLPQGPDFFQFSSDARLSAALLETGFVEPVTVLAEQFWTFTDSDGLMACFVEGSVRARGLILGQTDSIRQLIAEQVGSGCEIWRSTDGRYRVPMHALIGRAQKP